MLEDYLLSEAIKEIQEVFRKSKKLMNLLKDEQRYRRYSHKKKP